MTQLEREMRPIIESEIERLISLLDLLDGDADFEPDGNDELECEDEGAQCDDEGAEDARNDWAFYPKHM